MFGYGLNLHSPNPTKYCCSLVLFPVVLLLIVVQPYSAAAEEVWFLRLVRDKQFILLHADYTLLVQGIYNQIINTYPHTELYTCTPSIVTEIYI